MRSAGSPEAAKVLRDLVHRHFIDPGAKALGGKDAKVALGFAYALVTGFGVLRDILGTDCFDGTPDEKMTDLFTSLLNACLIAPTVSISRLANNNKRL